MDLADLKNGHQAPVGDGVVPVKEQGSAEVGMVPKAVSPFSIRTTLKGDLFSKKAPCAGDGDGDGAELSGNGGGNGGAAGDLASTALVGSSTMAISIPVEDGMLTDYAVDDPVAPVGEAPYVSIVIPVYNESAILETALMDLCRDIRASFKWSFELLVAENGSTDDTLAKAKKIAQIHPEIRVLSAGEPNYGLALRKGILQSRGRYVICDEIDLCDVGFYRRALEKLESGCDMVVGSKLLSESEDRRPFIRRFASKFFTFLLRISVGFKGTDTHGLKAFNRAKLVEVVNACKVDKDVFASELVVRAGRSKRKIVEIPLMIEEKRMPSIRLFRRVPRVLKDLFKLTMAIRFNR